MHLIWVGRGFEAWKSIIDYCAVEIFNTVSVTDNQIVQMSTLAVSGVICCPMLLFDNDAAAAAFGCGDAVAGLAMGCGGSLAVGCWGLMGPGGPGGCCRTALAN